MRTQHHRQRLLLFRYNRKNRNYYENLIRQPSEKFSPSFSRCGSLDSPPIRPPRKSQLKENLYQSIIDDNSMDSDGSNITSTTTTAGDLKKEMENNSYF
jgi:hypothetical protein